jgi:hypothetical protein
MSVYQVRPFASSSLKNQPSASSRIFRLYSAIFPSGVKRKLAPCLYIGLRPSRFPGIAADLAQALVGKSDGRFSGVLKSRNARLTGFFTLTTNDDAMNTDQMCVSESSAPPVAGAGTMRPLAGNAIKRSSRHHENLCGALGSTKRWALSRSFSLAKSWQDAGGVSLSPDFS